MNSARRIAQCCVAPVVVAGEASGSSAIEGRGKQTAKEIADVLRQRVEQQGWIQ